MGHTKGECKISKSGHPNFDLCVVAEDGGSICHISNWPEKKANAELIKEAFNVTNKCGYTPRQLLEQRDELLEACKLAMKSEIDGSYISASNWWDIMKSAIQKATQ